MILKYSISQIKCFKSCRRQYFFKYVEELEPIEKSEALQIGTSYHELIELINKNGLEALQDEPNTKEKAMATAYAKYIYPHFKVKSAEEWFEYPLTDDRSLIGRVDGIADDGKLVEHKTTSAEITEQYEYDLQWDEQMLAYMLATGAREIYYTVCRKPTIRLCKNETEDEFFNRMVEWYDTDTEHKIHLLKLSRTDEEVERFKYDLLNITSEIEQTTHLYRNSGACKMWGRRCEYSSICLNYDPSQDYIEFQRRERNYGTAQTE